MQIIKNKAAEKTFWMASRNLWTIDRMRCEIITQASESTMVLHCESFVFYIDAAIKSIKV